MVTLRTWRRRSRVRWECQGGVERVGSIVRLFAFDFGESCWAGDDSLQGRPWPKIGWPKVRPGAALGTLLEGLQRDFGPSDILLVNFGGSFSDETMV